MNNIAIIDTVNQDIGLKIIFPNADYYVYELDKDYNKLQSMIKHNIKPIIINNHTQINSVKYDILFIIISLYDTTLFEPKYKQIIDYNKKIKYYFDNIINIINNNNFKKVAIFDNYDFNYDPNIIIDNPKINFFFKRYYSKNIKYNKNVYPYPFIMFGSKSIIEILLYKDEIAKRNTINKINKCCFFGNNFKNADIIPYKYNCDFLQKKRDRYTILNNLNDYVDFKINMKHEQYMNMMNNYKYAIDLLGVGCPNKRTFEILSSGSLIISQKDDLLWPFDEEFSNDTIFENEDEFINIINKLENDNILYNELLIKQQNIFDKYMNTNWIKNYILKIIN